MHSEVQPVSFRTSKEESDLAILIPSWDGAQDLWHPFFHCFFKYWPDHPYPLYLGSNTITYANARVQPILIGPDVDYSSNLIAMLRQIPHPWILYWLEDCVLSAQVDTTRLSGWIQLAKNLGAIYLRPIAIHPFAYSCGKSRELGEIPKGRRYRVSMSIAVWNKTALLELLRPGETPWEIERKGSRRSNALAGKFLCPTFWARAHAPIVHTHLVVKKRLRREVFGFLEKEGVLDYLKRYPIESFLSFFYVKCYFLVADIYGYLRWQWYRWFPHSSCGEGGCGGLPEGVRPYR